MNLCNAKQKAFAQRVYFDLKICRRWPKLHVYFDETKKWIFFLGTPSDDQPMTFVLPVSSDEQFTIDELFNLRSKLSSILPTDVGENIRSVLMAIIANDFTLGYFNFSLGLPATTPSEISQLDNSTVSMIDNEFIHDMSTEITDNEWVTTDPNIIWD